MKPIPLETRRLALWLEDSGLPRANVCRSLGISSSSLIRWRARLEPLQPTPEPPCWRCLGQPPPDPEAYLYLLGQYLGDGHLAPVGRGNGTRKVLRVYGDDAWPGLQREVAAAMLRALQVTVFTTAKRGCHAVEAISAHWECLLPQHGPGKKHSRPIQLTDWQLELVHSDPRPLIRGLIHSDGCRTTNRVVTRGTAYEYPRYFFSNNSEDILSIFVAALDLVGVAWRRPRPTAISIARRDAVEALDDFVGSKY